MTTLEQELEVKRASDLFYAALNRLLKGDSAPMLTVWAHGPDVTTMHPIGGREIGWEQVRGASNPLDGVLAPAVGASLPAGARAGFTRFQQDLRALRAAATDRDPAGVIGAVMETAYPEYLRARYEGAASRAEDIQQLAVFAKSYRTLNSLLSELILLGEMYGQDVGSGGSTDTERLVLSSIHQAKGLEWSVVFVIRMCEGSFPSDMALREDAGEEEERRIFYVATTRAKDQLYLTHPVIDVSLRGDGQLLLQPSRFLREIRFTLYEQGQIAGQPWLDADPRWEERDAPHDPD